HMADGVRWSAQADFLARLSDWDQEHDPAWAIQQAERAALLELNVPHFVVPADGSGAGSGAERSSGLARARGRLGALDEEELAWQLAVIRAALDTGLKPVTEEAHNGDISTSPASRSSTTPPAPGVFLAESDRTAFDLDRYAVRRGGSAAWIGLGWLGDTDVAQLEALGPNLYNGTSGIALFLAAHASVCASETSRDLALAAVDQIRRDLKSLNAPRLARSLGIGGATGLGSVIYALTSMARLLRESSLLDDAHAAAVSLFTNELIGSDKQLDVIGGSAGAILSLLRLWRSTGSDDVLRRAVRCGEHLLTQDRLGPDGRRSWAGKISAGRPLNGMSHGAAGFAYALAALAGASGRQEFADAASECRAFENASFDPSRANWPDVRDEPAGWPSRWCHGAIGIGLARIGMTRWAIGTQAAVAGDIEQALRGAEHGWPGHVDTLCCGSLGCIEFLGEAGRALARPDLIEDARHRLAEVVTRGACDGYRWNVSSSRYNLGLFRGIAGIGYACLRRVSDVVPNVLIWE
ncbi:MAG: type 2 lantipeptide synthetase LanM, partial [Hyphomicrobiaceae bacterium]